MIQGKTIVCFASGYEAPPTSKHHVMHLLARQNTVLWVGYHASRAPSARPSDLLHLGRKLGHVTRGLRTVRPNLHVLTPLAIPLPGSRWARAINHRLILGQVRRALREVQTGPVQIWSFCPDISYLLGQLREEKVLYYCVDDFASFEDYDRAQVQRDEADLCAKADLVVTTSQKLHDAKAPLNRRTILMPHGVDHAHFARALDEPLDEPADLRGLGRPRILFVGLIRAWVDLALLEAVAKRRPGWHFVFLGDSTENLAALQALPNAHFLGIRPYAQLPAYCRACDAGVIPFRMTEMTRSINPIKLQEYLAAGLSVVSTPLPEAARWQPWVLLADGPDAFEAALADAISQPPAARADRSKAVAGETWDAKVETLCAALMGDSA